MKPCLRLSSVIGLVVSLTACQILESTGTAPAISRDRCEADGDFVFIPTEPFINGSDRVERDFAYRISAEASADSPGEVAKTEQRLRDRKWFDREADRQQRTAADLPSFCLSRNLVTNEDYLAFVQATGHRTPGISAQDYQEQGFLVHPYSEVKPFLWRGDRYPEGEGQHPVVLVSYEDAEAFATWHGEQDGATYRLPTAPEWEKAARGTDGRYFPWGNDWQPEATNSASSGLWHTSAIASFPLSRSPYGVEDMAGNVFEYTSTLRSRGEDTVAVMKGCSWDDLPGFCRAAYRHTRPIDSRHILFGFRLVKVAASQGEQE